MATIAVLPPIPFQNARQNPGTSAHRRMLRGWAASPATNGAHGRHIRPIVLPNLGNPVRDDLSIEGNMPPTVLPLFVFCGAKKGAAPQKTKLDVLAGHRFYKQVTPNGVSID